MLTGKSHRSRHCYSEVNGGKSCAKLLELPDLDPGMNKTVIDEKICAGDAAVPLRCPEKLSW